MLSLNTQCIFQTLLQQACILFFHLFNRFLLCFFQEKRNNREETRLQQTLENNREVSEKLIPASIDTMETNLPQLVDKCNSFNNLMILHV